MTTCELRKNEKRDAGGSECRAREGRAGGHDYAARSQQLLLQEIDFIANPAFLAASAEHDILTPTVERAATAGVRAGEPQVAFDLPAHLARMCEERLLTAAEERALFQRMNYLKFRANTVRVRLDPACPNEAAVRLVEQHLADAEAIRNRLVRANVRLVISVVKKYRTTQFSFEELLSEGIVTLMAAVDKFDYDRGFRFSTYAYRSISRAAYRMIMGRQKELERVSGNSDAVTEVAEQRSESQLDEQTWHHLRDSLDGMLERLDARERLIIRLRFGLGKHRKPRTFQALADRLGVSKERVRQLEHRAVAKLRSMASACRMDELVDPLAIGS